ncbi:uncharacterized protein LOC131160423 [Malania oleifera]|uniref:uncharacterized protein LOC131160423 n=1 Tax=Malania oleifera TaxID=397392 RepID=UPI0025AEB936|nr:uncharacterized protein LOC131160423 [Malania oleifera]
MEVSRLRRQRQRRLKALTSIVYVGETSSAKGKRLIKLLQGHLAIQKTRINSIIRHSCADIAQLLQNGHHKLAVRRVGLLYRDQCRLSAYDQLEEYCECILASIQNISKDSLAADASEAVSSLIFAASRCGELPMLNSIRNLFRKHFGCAFVTANVELLPGNLVNRQIKQRLCVKSAPNSVKLKLIREITRYYTQDDHEKDGVGQEDEFLNLDIYSICNNDNFEENEMASSLIFAASRREELQKLPLLQNLFEELFGFEFLRHDIELLPGNHVESQIKNDLCINLVPIEAKLKLDHEMAGNHKDFLHRKREFEYEEEKFHDFRIEDECKGDAGDNVQVKGSNEMPRKHYSQYRSSSDSEKLVVPSESYIAAAGMENQEELSVGTRACYVHETSLDYHCLQMNASAVGMEHNRQSSVGGSTAHDVPEIREIGCVLQNGRIRFASSESKKHKGKRRLKRVKSPTMQLCGQGTPPSQSEMALAYDMFNSRSPSPSQMALEYAMYYGKQSL